MPKDRVELKTAPPHADQEQRDNAHIDYLVKIFVGCRDKDFVEALAYRLLSSVRTAR